MNVYSETKAAADFLLGGMAGQGLRVVRLRPFNHTGPGQSTKFVVPALALQIARVAAGLQEPVLNVGDIETWRDFSDVRDICAAYVACIRLRHQLAPGTVLNLASGTARRVGDVLADLAALAGVTVDIRVDPARVRRNEIPMACGDASLARNVLGWQPEIPWTQTLRDVLDDCRTQAKAGA
jgi:GDP-4-dehydro-6-deoxy-D-mannose reductase